MPRYHWLRRAPLGVLVLGALLGFLGGAVFVVGSYLALSRREAGWMAWGAALAVGPLLLYMAVQLTRLARWAWLAMVLLLVLLAGSSAVRLVITPDIPMAPLGELAAEGLALLYLLRPHVRRAFGRS
ncbi:MAG TPA: hypothetical protein VFI96_01350 [Longimicrobiaceae bacterium]|nr:hypothetical protein [Longimicrobiaceae bacterium]